MKLVVNWPLCDGNGMCTVEAPELLDLDDDGNLVVISETVPPEMAAKAQAAVTVCPKQALRLEKP